MQHLSPSFSRITFLKWSEKNAQSGWLWKMGSIALKSKDNWPISFQCLWGLFMNVKASPVWPHKRSPPARYIVWRIRLIGTMFWKKKHKKNSLIIQLLQTSWSEWLLFFWELWRSAWLSQNSQMDKIKLRPDSRAWKSGNGRIKRSKWWKE